MQEVGNGGVTGLAQSAEIVSANWEERSVALQFCLSERRLFAATLRMARLGTHFTQLTGDLNQWAGHVPALPERLDGLYIRSHPIESPLPVVATVSGVLRYAPNQTDRYFMDLTGRFDDYVGGLGKSSRRELKRQTFRYTQLCGGKLPVREYRSPNEMEEFYRFARHISARSYQELLMHGGFPEGQAVIDDLREQAAVNAVRGYVLLHGDRPVAYQCIRHREGILYEPLYAYDQEYRKWGPGAVLQFWLLERWMNEGAYRVLDHGPGVDYHQVTYATHRQRCAELYFLRDTARLRLMVGLHRVTDSLSVNAGRILRALGIKDAAKRLLKMKN